MPIRDAVARSVAERQLTLVVGGNNAVTRPAALGIGMPLESVGLITLDAHFDMRGLEHGLSNGNPVRALIEDGLPGRNIAQIGLASFANSAAMHRDAIAGGHRVVTMEEVRRGGIDVALEGAIAHLTHCEALLVDCDVRQPSQHEAFGIEEAQLPLEVGRAQRSEAAFAVLIGRLWQLQVMRGESYYERTVSNVVKGGLLVDVMGLRGFIPSSHLRVKVPYEELVTQTLTAAQVRDAINAHPAARLLVTASLPARQRRSASAISSIRHAATSS